MKNDWRRRLAHVEARAGISKGPRLHIVLCFTNCKDVKDFGPKWAQRDGREWHRRAEETAQEFQARIDADIESAGGSRSCGSLMADHDVREPCDGIPPLPSSPNGPKSDAETP